MTSLKQDDLSSSQAPIEREPRSQDWHDRWVWLSRLIVNAGIILGAIAKMLFGREFESTDRYIGPLLNPLVIIWVLAFGHVLYTGLRGQLSPLVRGLCYGVLALFGVILLWVVIVYVIGQITG